MTPTPADALAIWQAGVDAVRSDFLLPGFLEYDPDFCEHVARAPRVIVVGGGKAGAAMAGVFEHCFPWGRSDKITGVLNVPAGAAWSTQHIKLHVGRPAASNHPTAAGVAGSDQMLELLRTAGPDDVAVCLISGGGSALLPAPDGVTLEDKQAVTKLLHACGATINEMNAVRKHLSRLKGGRLAQAFTGRRLFSLIISDVVGDPLDVIASGPTAVDPTTFADALAVLEKYKLSGQVPNVVKHLQAGAAGEIPETLKTLPANVRNVLLGNSAVARNAAQAEAERRGYAVTDFGDIEGDTRAAADLFASRVRTLSRQNHAPHCLISGGETTVTLGPNPGKGGRNQEFVLAMLHALGEEGMRDTVILSGGTDGEDGPTDAAGAVADASTLAELHRRGVDLGDALERHDAYHVFAPVGALIKTGLTHTNVMDLRVILVGGVYSASATV